jgi:hypothetical protein
MIIRKGEKSDMKAVLELIRELAVLKKNPMLLWLPLKIWNAMVFLKILCSTHLLPKSIMKL